MNLCQIFHASFLCKFLQRVSPELADHHLDVRRTTLNRATQHNTSVFFLFKFHSGLPQSHRVRNVLQSCDTYTYSSQRVNSTDITDYQYATDNTCQHSVPFLNTFFLALVSASNAAAFIQIRTDCGSWRTAWATTALAWSRGWKNANSCFKKLHLVKVGAFAWHSIKIHVIFGVQFERRKVDKKQTYMKTETCEHYARVFWIVLLQNQINPYRFELYRFKVGVFLRHSVV